VLKEKKKLGGKKKKANNNVEERIAVIKEEPRQKTGRGQREKFVARKKEIDRKGRNGKEK